MSRTTAGWIKAGRPRPKLVAGAVTLRDQINKKWPKRDRRSDGWIGDLAHQGRASDHNPDARGYVHAIDIDHNMGSGEDRRSGANAQKLADELIAYARRGTPGSERLKYVIYNNQIASGTYKDRYWVWRKGNYGHTQHIHISFTNTGENDSRAFPLPILGATPIKENVGNQITKPGFPGKARLSYKQKNESVRRLQKQLIARGYKIPAGATAYYGDQTRAAVKSLYHRMKKNHHGRDVGPAAWEFLFSE